ncbi:MAG: S1 RNA-binding domain-containing protein [Anaerolinea sp.]|nr:S1 RNA-binding domain-containing protein [Anaerolinea sp.]
MVQSTGQGDQESVMNEEMSVNENVNPTAVEDSAAAEAASSASLESAGDAQAAPAITAERSRSLDELAPGMAVTGVVKRIELFGAFVDIGVGKDGLLHISQLGQNVRNVGDVVQVGQTLTVYIMRIDREQGRIALSLVRQPSLSWDDLNVGRVVTGKVTRLEKFGVFVDIGAERDAMIHVSELSDGYVNSPADVVQVGDEITAQVIKVNRKQRRIDLSRKALLAPPKVEKYVPEDDEPEDDTTALGFALRRAMSASGEDMYSERGGRDRRREQQKRERRERRRNELEEVYERTLRNNR